MSVLFEHAGIQLIRYDQLTERFRQQIAQTILGREGQLRYQHTYGTAKAAELKDTVYLELQWRQRLIGVIALSLQKVQIGNEPCKVIYVRYFSISGLMTNRQGQQNDSKKDKKSIIKEAIISIFNQPQKLFPDEQNIAGFYAYVEEKNLPSRRNVEMTGFEKVGQFSTWLYSRVNPTAKLKLSKADPSDLPSIYEQLSNYYHDYDLTPQWKELLVNPRRSYFVYEVNGESVFGACVTLNQWKIHEIPGWTGKLNQLLLSRLPFLKKIFFRDVLDFIDLEMIYITPGYEQRFADFIESLLYAYRLNHAMLWSDTTSGLHRQIRKGGRWGLLQKLSPATAAGVYFKSLRPETSLKSTCYISADGIS